MESRSIRMFVGGACAALLVSLTVSAGGSGKAEGQPGNQMGPGPFDVVVVNDETAPVNIQGFVANIPPVRFQELISAVETGEGEACGAVVRIDGKRKVVEQVVIEAAPLQELTGPNVYLLVTGTGNLLRIETDLVRITDETPNGSRTRWGGRFEGPFLVGNEPQHNLAICARNGTQVRAFAIGIIEDLP